MSTEKLNLYFDATATKPIDADLLAEYCANLKTYYANPAAVYDSGLASKKLIQDALADLAKYFGVESRQLLVTSGATESTNTVFYNFAKRHRQQDVILLGAGEHQASQIAAYRLAKDLNLKLVIVPLADDYRLNLSELENLFKQYGERILALSNLSVSNETGTINDLAAISRLLKQYAPKALWHVDDVQGWGKIYFDFTELKVDYVTLAGHKIGAPKGIGLLYIREPKYFQPFIVGGGQQNNLRSGTENPPLVRALALANSKHCALAELDKNWKHLSKLRNLLLTELKPIDYVCHTANEAWQYPGLLALSFKDIRGEVLLHSLERYGIAVSTSSSCHNLAAGTKNQNVFGEPIFKEPFKDNHLRITLTSEHTEADIKYLANAIKQEVNLLRSHK